MNEYIYSLQVISLLLVLYAKDYIEKSVKARYYCLLKIRVVMPNKEHLFRKYKQTADLKHLETGITDSKLMRYVRRMNELLCK